MTARYSEECPLFTSRKPCHLSRQQIMVCSECIPKKSSYDTEADYRKKVRLLVRLTLRIHQ
jgi:hypothetical protein